MNYKPHTFLPFLLIAMMLCACTDAQNETNGKDKPDFRVAIKRFCKDVAENYAYFEDRSAHWPEACQLAIRDASLVDDGATKLAILERLVDDLYDPHVSLNTNNQHSPRLVPTGSDLYFELQDNTFVVTGVRPSSGAANAGVKIGDKLVSFNELTADELALTRIHSGRKNITEDRLVWAVNAAIAGRRDSPRDLVIAREGKEIPFTLGEPTPNSLDTLVSYKFLSENIGYIRINNSLGEQDTPDTFNIALNELKDSSGIILDLRETPSGGDSITAEPIMGRFFDQHSPYQVSVPLNGKPEIESASPNGRWIYNKPLIILVGRWTGSMGEGMAIGFDGSGRGHVMGSSMAGLAGGTEPIEIQGFDVAVWMPVYDLHHLDGTPRHLWSPAKIDLADNGNEADLLLKGASEKMLQQQH